MNELEVYKRAYGKVVNQVAQMTANLELAYSQIDILNEKLAALQEKNNEEENKDSK